MRDVLEGKGVFGDEEGGFLPAFRKDLVNLFQKVMDKFRSMVDKLADIIPGMTSTAEASVDKLKKLGLFEETTMNVFKDDLVAMDKIRENLKAGTITQTDVANLLKDQAKDLSTADVKELAELAGEAGQGMEVTSVKGDIIKLQGETLAKGGIIRGSNFGPFIATKPTYLPDVGAIIGEHASSIVNGAVKGMYSGGVIKDGPDELVTNKPQLQAFIADAAQPAMKGMMLNAMEMQKQMLTDTTGASQQNITSGNVGAIDNSSTTIVTAKAPNPNSSMFREIDAENYRGV